MRSNTLRRWPSPSTTVARALAEDLGGGDVTSEATVPADARGRARILQKQPGVVFGLAAVAEAMGQCGADHVDNLLVEGQWREDVPAEVLLAAGPARALLAAERPALQLPGRLSGTATLTARYTSRSSPTRAAARSSTPARRLPGLRQAQKYAVRVGGGGTSGWRSGDGILIKENHIAIGGRPPRGPRGARPIPRVGGSRSSAATSTRSARRARHGADLLLLDNMNDGDLREAVRLRDENSPAGKGPSLEASGGVSLETVRATAETGVDLISVGALTHSAPTLDFSMLHRARPSRPCSKLLAAGP